MRATFLSLSEEKKATSAGLKRLRRSRRPLAYSLGQMFSEKAFQVGGVMVLGKLPVQGHPTNLD